MKHTKEEILSIAKEVLKKINFSYDPVADFILKEVNENDHRFTKPTWMVGFEFGKPYIPSQDAFLYIDDETGKPLLIMHSQAKIILTVKNDGTIEKTAKRFGQK